MIPLTKRSAVIKNLINKNMKTTNLSWHTEKRIVSVLVPNQKNPRLLNASQKKALLNSLKKFGLVEIPVIDTNNRLIAGHQRVMALKLLGNENEEIDVRVPNRELTQEEYDTYLLSSNRISGDWNWDILMEHFDQNLMLDSGFESTDFSNFLPDLGVKNDKFNIEEEIKKIGTPKSKTGELYQLGRHLLFCGDSTDPRSIKILMGDKKVSTIYQDPPFNIGLSYDKGIGGNGNYGGQTDDSKTDSEYREFLKKTLLNGLSVCEKDAHIFTYSDQKYVWLLQTLYQELGIENKRVCLWIKNGFGVTPQVAFNKCYEPCIYGTICKPYLSNKSLNFTEIMNKEISTGNQGIQDIYDTLDIWMANRINGTDYEHPTEKPPVLHERALRRCTKVNDSVLDMFGGSGSLLVACEQLQRTAYLIEKEPVFVDLIIRRYEKLTGNKAVKIDEKTFD